MRSSWSDPYLWVHLAGIAAVPIFLELCLIGLAASQTVLPAGLVFLLVAVVGISPILWMQWHRPFSIFSLVVLALKPSELTEMQRQILQRFKAPVARVVAVAVAILAFLILWQLTQWLPFHAPILNVSGGWLGGLVLAAGAFLLSNLFLQVPASALTVLLTPERQIAAATPYPVAQIPADFTLIGLQVKQILPPIVPTVAPTSPPSPTVSAPVSDGPKPVAESAAAAVQPDIFEPAITPSKPVESQSHDSSLSSDSVQAELGAVIVEEAETAVASTPPEPPIFEPVLSNLDEPNLDESVVEAISEAADAENLEADSASDLPELPISGKASSVEQQIPHVTDTVVMINLPPVGGAASEGAPVEDESSEGTAFESVVSALPTVTDTVVTVGLP